MNALGMLKATGVARRVNPKWKTARGSSRSFDPRPGGTAGVIIHHTASRKSSGNMPSERVVVKGRSDLRGPLSQFLLGRDGEVLLVSQNRCNHAGTGRKSRLRNCQNDVLPPDFGQGAYNAGKKDNFKPGGNGHFWGIEVENDGSGEKYSRVQVEALVKLLGGLCEWQGWDPLTRIIHHREWTRRKPDMTFKGPIRKIVETFMDTNVIDISPEDLKVKHPMVGNPTLKKGDSGKAVKKLQRALRVAEHKLKVDGDFGPVTKGKVKAFQKQRGLKVDGIVGKRTWAALLAADN